MQSNLSGLLQKDNTFWLFDINHKTVLSISELSTGLFFVGALVNLSGNSNVASKSNSFK